MNILSKTVFFGIFDSGLSEAMRQRVNYERAKIYFENSFGNLMSFSLGGGISGLILLYANVDLSVIGMWYALFVLSTLAVYFYSRHIVKIGLTRQNFYQATINRSIFGLVAVTVWGLSALLLPSDDPIALMLAFISFSGLVAVAVLGFTTMPIYYINLNIGGMFPFIAKLLFLYITVGGSFFLMLLLISITWQAVILKKALRTTAISMRSIILNEQLKDEIEEHKLAKETIEHHAHHDYLTGAANRRYFESRFAQAIKSQSHVGLLLLDLDDFKPVNDTYGHEVGDVLLQKVVENIQSHIEPTDVLARIGGDEFAILALGKNHEALERLHTTLTNALDTTYTIDNQPIRSRASIGFATLGMDGTTLPELQKVADAKMYKEKRKLKR